MDELYDIADSAIEEAYPDVAKKGKGWWGESRIPNYGILRGAIVKALAEIVNREKGNEDKRRT